MKFNIYCRFQADVRRESEFWIVYRSELGKRTRMTDIVIPPDLVAQDLATYLDEIFHKFASFRENVEVILNWASSEAMTVCNGSRLCKNADFALLPGLPTRKPYSTG